MMVSNVASSVALSTGKKSVTSIGGEQSGSGFGPEYQVELSSNKSNPTDGLAINSSATGITESKMRNVLTRILLETLFGTKEPSPTESKTSDETAEEELVREVVQDPALEAQISSLSSQNL